MNLAATSLFATLEENYVHPDKEDKKVTNCATRTPDSLLIRKKEKKATEKGREREQTLIIAELGIIVTVAEEQPLISTSLFGSCNKLPVKGSV